MADSSATTEEKEMTMKEREDWLKERGVLIENPSDRSSNHGSSSGIVQQVQQLNLTRTAPQDKQEGSTSFVYIPQDESKAMATLQLPADFRANNPGDAIPKYVQSFFADSKTIDTNLLKEQATKQFAGGGQLKGVDPEKISTAAMQSVTAQGSVETFPLVHPADTNRYTGVYIYLDEVGLLKNLPQNKRASQMAATCGYHPPPLFYGDVFVGRCQTRPVMTNTDFEAPVDTSATAEWMQRAVSENLAWQQAMNVATGKPSGTTQPNVKGTEGEEVTEDSYVWTQTEEEVEMRVQQDDKSIMEKAKLKVKFQTKSVKVEYDGRVLVDVTLYGKVDMDGCTWTLDDGGKTLVVTCEKQDDGQMWPRIQLTG